MKWTADWWLWCDECNDGEVIDGNTVELRIKNARHAGWKIRDGKATCPKCAEDNKPDAGQE